jgi:hypothetical protein
LNLKVRRGGGPRRDSSIIEERKFSIEGYHSEYGSICNFSSKEDMEDITIHLLFSSWVISSRSCSLFEHSSRESSKTRRLWRRALFLKDIEVLYLARPN